MRTLADLGFTVVERLLAEDAIASLDTIFRAHEEASIPTSAEVLFTHAPPPDREERGLSRLMRQWLNPHRRSPPLSTAAIARSLRPTIERWLGGPAVLFQDLLLEKVASHRTLPWHQDFAFWPVDVPLGLVVWAPLEPVDEASGGLALAARSHLSGPGPSVDLHTGLAQEGSRGEVIDEARYEIVRPALSPGDAIVFHPLLWHASPVNRAGRRRRAWASSWLGASVRWSLARAPRHPLCPRLDDGAPVTAAPKECA